MLLLKLSLLKLVLYDFGSNSCNHIHVNSFQIQGSGGRHQANVAQDPLNEISVSGKYILLLVIGHVLNEEGRGLGTSF